MSAATPHELSLVLASSTSHVLVIIAGVIVLVLTRALWVFGRRR
jgi:hypothetical protein